MGNYCYILHSQNLDRFYTGSTELDVDQRLNLHLHKEYGNRKFTAKTDDWTIFLVIPCQTIQQARSIEAHIKKMKSKVYIQNLKRYPEMIPKLIKKYPA